MCKLKALMLVMVMALPTVGWTAPVSFNFTQEGFDEGAMVTGMFSGEDLDMDGQLVHFPGSPEEELTSFMMEFSGNSLVAAFSLDLSDLNMSNFGGFVYDLNGGPLGDGFDGFTEGIAVDDGSSFGYNVGPGPAEECGIGFDCASVVGPNGFSLSKELVIVTPKAVPTPSALLLMGTGLLGLIGYRKYATNKS